MKALVKAAVRKASRVAAQDLALRRVRGDSFDILELAFLGAAMQSARFYERHMLTAEAYESDLDLLAHAFKIAPPAGSILEFGVASGRTIRHLASLAPRHMEGFDSFEGLPEAWRTGFDEGKFKQPVPEVPGHVRLHVGRFSDTLPPFIAGSNDRVALLHLDCDLYSSTAFVLETLATRIIPGTVIVFDEYFNYPGWQRHAYKAFKEFTKRHRVSFKYDSFVPTHQQVCVVILNPPV